VTTIRFFNTYEPVSPFYRDLLPALADQGLDVEVVVTSLEYREGRKPLEESLRHPRIKIRRIPAGQGVVRGRLQKLWAMMTYMLGASLFSLFGPRASLNFFLTQPPLFALWGYVLRLLRHQSYCCLVMDLYPDVAVQDGLLAINGRLVRGLTRLSRFVLRRADAVIVIGRCMQERLQREGISTTRLHVIPNWVNESEVTHIPHQQNSLRQSLGLDGKFVVLYSGNLGVSHFLDDILEAARQLRTLPNLVFLFVGDGVRRQEIIKFKQVHELYNIRLLPLQPVEQLAESLSMGDVHFISLRSGFAGLVVPSKAYGALGAGRPIMYQGEKSGEIARMVEEEGVGTVVPLGDLDGLSSAIQQYHSDPGLVISHGQRALALSHQKYSCSQALSQYLALMQQLTGIDKDD
jgi:colanic acid biosynthesis glycosyl transferase WcaI